MRTTATTKPHTATVELPVELAAELRALLEEAYRGLLTPSGAEEYVPPGVRMARQVVAQLKVPNVQAVLDAALRARRAP